GTVFGAIHSAAWKADFASADERWMWRACALLVTTIPLIVPLCSTVRIITKAESKVSNILVAAALLVGIPAYIIARLFLIIIPFTALRALPPGAFADVDWRVYIPHF
ncbi:hypothetical protein DFH09DRAFT_848201, partial [Mycena vulgaris]